MKKIALLFAVTVVIGACAPIDDSIEWEALEADAGLGFYELRNAITADVRGGNCKSIQSWFDYADARGRISRAKGLTPGWSKMMGLIDNTLREVGCYDEQGYLLETAQNPDPEWTHY